MIHGKAIAAMDREDKKIIMTKDVAVETDTTEMIIEVGRVLERDIQDMMIEEVLVIALGLDLVVENEDKL